VVEVFTHLIPQNRIFCGGGNTTRGPERRSVTYETIENLLLERQELWVLYERLAGVEPYEG